MKKTTKFILRKATKYAIKGAKKAAVKYAEDAAKQAAGLSDTRDPLQVTDTIILREMQRGDKEAVLRMMRAFYASEAVLTNGSDQIFLNDFRECVSDSPFAEGFVFVKNESEDSETQADANKIIGYAIIAHSFSTEYGKHCIWIEDLYLRREARGFGIGPQFLDYLASEYPDALHRLEAERENESAMEVYKRKDFKEMPYVEMFRQL